MAEITPEQGYDIALDRIRIAAKSSVTKLDLSQLSLKSIPPDLWQLTNLTTLDISGGGWLNKNNNKLTKLPAEIGQLVNLTKLNISDSILSNQPISMPSELWNLTHLTELDMSGNSFFNVPAGLWQLTNLTKLGLSYSQLTKLPNEISQLTKLTELDIAGNELNNLPASIGQLRNLVKLNVGSNSLTSLPVEIEQLINLTKLNIRSNKFVSLPLDIGRLTNLTKLDISNNKISSLPAEIGQLTKLIELDISENQLTNLPIDIGQLKNLTTLFINNNQLTGLPAEISQLSNLQGLVIDGNQFTNLPSEIGQLFNLEVLVISGKQLTSLPTEIGQLTNLTRLMISHSELTNLPPEIGQLTNLTYLNISNNRLSYLPAEMEQLTKLTELDVSKNQLISLPVEIGELISLKKIDVSDNQLTSLPSEIGQLANLKSLVINNNRLISLPNEIGKLLYLRRLFISNSASEKTSPNRNKLNNLPSEILYLKHLKELDLRDNDLGIPLEILSRTKEPQLILNYFAQLLQEIQKPLAETKLLVVGQGSVGKTSVIKQITEGFFDIRQLKTEGISINHWQVNNLFKSNNLQPKIKLNLWDFGGQEIMHATHQFFLTKRSLYLLVLDSRITQEENRVEYWLKIIQSFGGASPVIIVGNKIDQHPLDIDRTGLQKKYPNIVGILETSAATGLGIEELKTAITEQVNSLPHVRDLLPETWFTVKTKLGKMAHEFNFITHDKYLELCAENEVSDETSQRTLISFLHDLGIVLHFQDDRRLEELGILNPQWVTNGVYKILNSHTLFQNKGVLTVSMLDDILNLPEYPRGKRLFIVDMMKKFELCYDIEVDKIFLVPDLLPKDEPADLKFNGVPAFEYAYPVLPSSVITRFIVRMNQKIENHFVWRTGVVLKIGENTALVKADIEDRKITIAIDGVEYSRRDALSAIRYQLDEIHWSIKGLDTQKRVPIPNVPNAESLKYEYLLMLEREGQETHLVQDGNRLVKVNVREILSAIESESQRHEAGGNVTNIFVGGNLTGNVVVGDSSQAIQDSYNKISSTIIEPELKEALKQLTEAVDVMKKSLPQKQAIEVTEDLVMLVDEAAKEKPNNKWYSVNIDGLIKAAENLDKLGEPVIKLSRKVLSLLMGGVVK